MNIGNVDITSTDQSVTLRLRHVVADHPGAVLALPEVRSLIRALEQAIVPKPAPEQIELEDAINMDLIG